MLLSVLASWRLLFPHVLFKRSDLTFDHNHTGSSCIWAIKTHNVGRKSPHFHFFVFVFFLGSHFLFPNFNWLQQSLKSSVYVPKPFWTKFPQFLTKSSSRGWQNVLQTYQYLQNLALIVDDGCTASCTLHHRFITCVGVVCVWQELSPSIYILCSFYLVSIFLLLTFVFRHQTFRFYSMDIIVWSIKTQARLIIHQGCHSRFYAFSSLPDRWIAFYLPVLSFPFSQ